MNIKKITLITLGIITGLIVPYAIGYGIYRLFEWLFRGPSLTNTIPEDTLYHATTFLSPLEIRKAAGTSKAFAALAEPHLSKGEFKHMSNYDLIRSNITGFKHERAAIEEIKFRIYQGRMKPNDISNLFSKNAENPREIVAIIDYPSNAADLLKYALKEVFNTAYQYSIQNVVDRHLGLPPYFLHPSYFFSNAQDGSIDEAINELLGHYFRICNYGIPARSWGEAAEEMVSEFHLKLGAFVKVFFKVPQDIPCDKELEGKLRLMLKSGKEMLDEAKTDEKQEEKSDDNLDDDDDSSSMNRLD